MKPSARLVSEAECIRNDTLKCTGVKNPQRGGIHSMPPATSSSGPGISRGISSTAQLHFSSPTHNCVQAIIAFCALTKMTILHLLKTKSNFCKHFSSGNLPGLPCFTGKKRMEGDGGLAPCFTIPQCHTAYLSLPHTTMLCQSKVCQRNVDGQGGQKRSHRDGGAAGLTATCAKTDLSPSCHQHSLPPVSRGLRIV